MTTTTRLRPEAGSPLLLWSTSFFSVVERPTTHKSTRFPAHSATGSSVVVSTRSGLHQFESKMAENTIKESTRYDRQIRVWGAEAQFRLQNAKVLIINFTNLNVEVRLLVALNILSQNSRRLS